MARVGNGNSTLRIQEVQARGERRGSGRLAAAAAAAATAAIAQHGWNRQRPPNPRGVAISGFLVNLIRLDSRLSTPEFWCRMQQAPKGASLAVHAAGAC